MWLETWAFFQVLGIWIQIFFAILCVIFIVYLSIQESKFQREQEIKRKKNHVDLSKYHEKETKS